MSSETGLCERDLDLQMAEVLPHRETLGLPAIDLNVIIAPTVTIQAGVGIATQVLSPNSVNSAWVFQYVH